MEMDNVVFERQQDNAHCGIATWGKLKKNTRAKRQQAGVTSYMDIPLPSNQATLSAHAKKLDQYIKISY